MSTSRAERPALGSRENWWGDDPDDDPDGGYVGASGTDPAEYTAHKLALELVDPICGRSSRLHDVEIPLSEPCMYLPKQVERDGRFIEYRQHRHRRRINEETGYINWGESTSTDIPEFDYDVFTTAVHTYLVDRCCRMTAVEGYLEYADRVWHDPSMNSKESLAQFVRHVRDDEGSRR